MNVRFTLFTSEIPNIAEYLGACISVDEGRLPIDILDAEDMFNLHQSIMIGVRRLESLIDQL